MAVYRGFEGEVTCWYGKRLQDGSFPFSISRCINRWLLNFQTEVTAIPLARSLVAHQLVAVGANPVGNPNQGATSNLDFAHLKQVFQGSSTATIQIFSFLEETEANSSVLQPWYIANEISGRIYVRGPTYSLQSGYPVKWFDFYGVINNVQLESQIRNAPYMQLSAAIYHLDQRF